MAELELTRAKKKQFGVISASLYFANANNEASGGGASSHVYNSPHHLVQRYLMS